MTVEHFLLGKDVEMHTSGQGYAHSSYKRYKVGSEGVRETFLKSWAVFASTRDRVVPRVIREVLWPIVEERPVSFIKFDPDKMLFRREAHAPLIVWICYQGRVYGHLCTNLSHPRLQKSQIWFR